MAQWVGCMVSVECAGDDKGTYQGEIIAATNFSITLTKAFCDGIPCDTEKVVIRAEDIADIKLIEKQLSPSGRSTITIAKPVPKRAGRTQTISESSNSLKNSQTFTRTRPIDIEQKTNAYEAGSFKNGTPSKKERSRGKWMKGRDEACFGSPLDPSISKDFDFEKNLALFDKQAVFDEINNSQKPDIIKHADQIRKHQQSRYRHDENIIPSIPASVRQITVPKQDFCEYVTDNGLIIPSISRSLRNKLWALADKYGLTWERRTELMGRAGAELSLQLVGGGQRLSPHVTHQWPTVVVLCGSHRTGAAGVNTARQLASHGVNTVVFISSLENSYVQQELTLYKLTKNKIVASVASLPRITDLIIIALSEGDESPTMYGDVANWANASRAGVLALDPPPCGTRGILTKYSLIPVLPLPHSSENGRLYLCNLTFPIEIFIEVGIKYQSPFGPKLVIPLHPNEES